MSQTPKKLHVCRRLFQDEHQNMSINQEKQIEIALRDNIENILKEQRLADRERAMRKWNFDFENEVPLEGHWEWERVEGEVVPERDRRDTQRMNQENSEEQEETHSL